MSKDIDNQIAAIERELAQLRRQKLSALEAEVSALRSLLGVETGNGSPRGPSPGVSSGAEPSPKGRRGRRGKRKRFTDEDAVAALTAAVRAGGREGIAGKQASEASGVSYPRAMQLLGANFKRSGGGKWTRFTLR